MRPDRRFAVALALIAVWCLAAPLVTGGDAVAQEAPPARDDHGVAGEHAEHDAQDRDRVVPSEDETVADTFDQSAAAVVGSDFVDVDIPARADVVTHQVTIALVAPQGTTPSFTKEEAARALELVDRFYDRETGGKVRFALERLIDWQVVDEPIACSNTGGLHEWISRTDGWTGGPARHLVAMVPPGDPCPNWANGEQPGDPDDGGRTFQGGPDAILLAHELGHNLSLNHASSVQCGSSWDYGTAPTAPDCQREEYGNRTDVMGDSWAFTPLSAPTLARLGTLASTRQPTCGAPRTAVIDTLGAGPGAPRVLTWTDPQNTDARYWLQYNDKADARADGGAYSSPWEVPRTVSGVQILRSSAERPGGDVLERPGDTTVGNEFVRAGETVALNGGMTVGVDAIDEASRQATVTVTVPCTQYVGEIAPLAARTASFTSDQSSVDWAADDDLGTFWSSWPRVGQQWVGLAWPQPVTIDSFGVRFASDAADDDRRGIVPARAWTLQYLDAAAGDWLEVPGIAPTPPSRDREVTNTASFPSVTASAVRVVFEAWGDWEGGGSTAVSELSVNGVASTLSMVPFGGSMTIAESTVVDLEQGVSLLDAAGLGAGTQPVTFTLSGAATFLDGSTSTDVMSDARGLAAVPAIRTGLAGVVSVTVTAPGLAAVDLAGATVQSGPGTALSPGDTTTEPRGAAAPRGSEAAEVDRRLLAETGVAPPLGATLLAALLIAAGAVALRRRGVPDGG